jgi:hypothetical protein
LGDAELDFGLFGEWHFSLTAGNKSKSPVRYDDTGRTNRTFAESPLRGRYSPLTVLVLEDLECIKLPEKVDASQLVLVDMECVLAHEACSSLNAFAFQSSYPSSIITPQGSKQEHVSLSSLGSGVRDCQGRILLLYLYGSRNASLSTAMAPRISDQKLAARHFDILTTYY